MSGISVELDMAELQQIIGQAVVQLNHPQLLFEQVGETLIKIHQDRFARQVSPDGQSWAPLSAWYRDQKSQNQDKILTLRGHLSQTLSYNTTQDGLEFGSNRVYAAIHQFGGTIRPKKAKALNVGGRPAKSVTIPARPWLGVGQNDQREILNTVKDHLKIALSL